MNGAQHYRKAEKLVEQADGSPRVDAGLLIAVAQVHATLALAAATAETHVRTYLGDESRGPREWTATLS